MSRRIAIVEDDPSIRENYADVLRRQGYEVAAFQDRPTAMQAIHLHFTPLVGSSFYAMDLEFKLDWPDRALVIKQARPFPKPGE